MRAAILNALILVASRLEDLSVRAVDDNEASHVEKPVVLISEFYKYYVIRAQTNSPIHVLFIFFSVLLH